MSDQPTDHAETHEAQLAAYTQRLEQALGDVFLALPMSPDCDQARQIIDCALRDRG